MTEHSFSRRTFVQTLAAGAAGSALLGGADAASALSFSRVESPTQKSIQAVTMTEEGPYAAAGSGDLVARRVGGWEQGYEKILDAGLTAQSKDFHGADASADGRNFWACGGSGIVGQYDVVDEQFTDYSHPDGLTDTFHDVAVTGSAGEETVRVVTGSGELVTGQKTAEGGMDWSSPRQVNDGNTIRALVVHGDGTGWFCDTAANVYQTTDGGDTWTRIGVDAASVSLYDVDGAGTGDVTAVGSSGYVYSYDGSSWTEHKPGEASVRAVEYANGDAIAVGSSGYAYTRDDAGAWTAHDVDSSKTFRDVALDTTGTYPDVISGNSGRLFERDDFTTYPDTVTVASNADATTTYAFDVTARTRKAASADSTDTVETTSSGHHVSGTVGGSDSKDAYDYGGDVSGFTVTDGTAADLTTSVSGTEVSVERLANRSWTRVSTPVSKTLYDVVDSGAGLYAVGGSGRVIARNDGSWEVVLRNGPTGGGNNLLGAGTTDDGSVVWFGGGSGALGRLDTTTGTITNHTAPDGHTSTFRDLAVTGTAGSESIYVVNGSGEFIRGTNDGGTYTWSTPVKPGNGSTIHAVTFLDEATGYVCDGNGRLHETTDGGDTWTDIGVDGAGVTLYDVAVQSRDDITAVGGSGKLFRYNGAVWTTTKLGGNSRYGVDRQADRGVTAGGGAQIFERELRGWSLARDDASDVGLRATLITDDPDVPKIAVGGSGVVLEQSFDDPLY
ncbi:WD40/YVTN/BNR-like repeat-containing protein [Halarchaeum sp. P4]|uniref:WD40/YVTN/BNR-like repeat-containing protein n=1 Tax=Halarchaeum sp. P4 TaxID=3421639 RepID=UPI003EB78473